METMQLKYGAAAKEAKCFITSAVGFDCIPADVGAALAVSAMHDKGLKPHTVDSFLIIDWGPAGACGHFATLCALPPSVPPLTPPLNPPCTPCAPQNLVFWATFHLFFLHGM